MKIYKAEYYDQDMGKVLAWFTSKKAAFEYLSKIKHNHYKHESQFTIQRTPAPSRSSLIEELGATVEACEFKATRQGIVDWLSSSHFAERDNG